MEKKSSKFVIDYNHIRISRKKEEKKYKTARKEKRVFTTGEYKTSVWINT